MDAMEKTRAKVIFKHVFWASLAAGMPVVADNKITQTMATDMRRIYYNTDWFAAQTSGVQLFGFVHEVAHKFALHEIRRQGRHPLLWNIAGDHEINLRLKEAGFEVWDKACCDPKFADKSAEQIYELLKKEMQEQGGGKGDAQSVPGMGQDILEPSGGMSEEQKAEMERDVMAKVAQAATLAKQAGQMSAGLQRFVDSILRPKTPWWDQLRLQAKRLVRTDENWTVRNRRFSDFYMPGLKGYQAGEIVMICDTSGSISDKDLQLVAGIAMDCFEELRPSKITMIYWDADFAGSQEFANGERPQLRACGGGGTRMDLALEHVSKHFDNPEAVIMITDGESPFGKEPDYPLYILTTSKPAPIGVNIHVST